MAIIVRGLLSSEEQLWLLLSEGYYHQRVIIRGTAVEGI